MVLPLRLSTHGIWALAKNWTIRATIRGRHITANMSSRNALKASWRTSSALIGPLMKTPFTSSMADRLGRLLLVTLEAARVNADLPVFGALRSWLDSRRGI